MKFLVTLSFCLLLVEHGFSQFKNIKLDDQSESNFVHDPAIAINPKNPLNIVAASAPKNIYYTTDGGVTWKKREVQSSFGVNGHPSLIADGSGTFHFFHSADSNQGKGDYAPGKSARVVGHRSENDGDTWSDGVSIGFNPPKDQGNAIPALDSKGNLMLTWTQFDSYGSNDATCESTIMMSTSKNGTKWSDPVIMSRAGNCSTNDSTVMGAMPAITFDGKAFVAWAANEKIYLDRSYGGDLWLSNDIQILDQPGGWNLKIPGHKTMNGLPTFITDKSKTGFRGYLYLLWSDQRNGSDNTDVWFSRSTNYGDNWSTPLNIGISKNGHQYLPSMTIDQTNGNIYVVYYDRSAYTDLQTDVNIAWSTDAGASFRNVTISEKPFVPGGQNVFGDYINIAAHKGIITPVWTRIDNGKTSVWTSVIKHADLEAATNKK